MDSTIGSDMFLQFSTVLVNLKLFHLTTDSYVMHKNSDTLYSDLSENFDLLMETYSGKYGKIKLSDSNIEIDQTTKPEIVNYISLILKYIDSFISKFDSVKDSDLCTILDNIKISMNKFIYFSAFS
jgi:hypothetical protein